jgi:type IV secretion system protein VirB6
MISPVGSFIVSLDNQLMAAIGSIVSAMATWVATPLSYCACFYLLVQGVRLANGDLEVAHGFVLRLVRVVMIVWLATNLTAYTAYVQQAICTDLPNALTSVVTSTQGRSADVSSVASSFDNLYAQVSTVVATAWQSVSFSIAGFGVILAGMLTTAGAGLGLLLLAVVFVVARLMIAIMICLGPLLIACGLFDWSRVFLERAIGKVVSLILLQVVSFLMISIMINISQTFMVQVSNSSLIAAANSGALPQLTADLMGLFIWFVAAGLAAVFLSYKIAYSIGTGVALAGPSIASAIMLARAAAGGGHGGSGGAATIPSSPLPNYSLSLAQPQLAASVPALALPPPPPPLHTSRS